MILDVTVTASKGQIDCRSPCLGEGHLTVKSGTPRAFGLLEGKVGVSNDRRKLVTHVYIFDKAQHCIKRV